MFLACEYCNNIFSNKSSLKAHQKRAQYCINIRKQLQCPVESEKTYNVPNSDCTNFARNIFEAIVQDIGTGLFEQLANNINIARISGLITPEDSSKLFISLDQFIEDYYRYIDNVVFRNQGSVFAGGEKYIIQTPKQWATTIRTLQRKVSDIDASINNVLQAKIKDISGKDNFKQKPIQNCYFPCKQTGLINKKCTYKQP